jgi:prepilin-type N-terminal cleavage/methylation domain-containing protein
MADAGGCAMMEVPRKLGYTLLEMITVMALLSFLMSLAGAWIIQTMRFDSAVRQQSNHHATMLRLDQQLRGDIQAGRSMSMIDGDQLIITLDEDRTANYRIDEQRIEYRQLDGERVVRHESFALLSASSARWDTSAMPNSIGLILHRGKASGISDVIDLHVRGSVRPAKFLVPVNGTMP